MLYRFYEWQITRYLERIPRFLCFMISEENMREDPHKLAQVITWCTEISADVVHRFPDRPGIESITVHISTANPQYIPKYLPAIRNVAKIAHLILHYKDQTEDAGFGIPIAIAVGKSGREEIIDAITRSSSALTADSHKVKYVGSPNDLTGMDIRFSQLTEEIMKGEFTDDPNQLFPTPIRYCILSLTSMLMFRKIDVIYQFLHVVTSKLKKMGSIGVFLINSETFDQKTVAIVKQLMNVVVEIRNDEMNPSMRIQGTMGMSMNWRQFQIEEGELIFST